MTSLFGVFQNLSADEKVVVTDIKGEKISFVAEHYYAREICHEVDHLDGILIVDREECE